MSSDQEFPESKIHSPTPKRISIELGGSQRNKFLTSQEEQSRDKGIWNELNSILGKPDYPLGFIEVLTTPSPVFEDIPSRVSLNLFIYDEQREVSV